MHYIHSVYLNFICMRNHVFWLKSIWRWTIINRLHLIPISSIFVKTWIGRSFPWNYCHSRESFTEIPVLLRFTSKHPLEFFPKISIGNSVIHLNRFNMSQRSKKRVGAQWWDYNTTELRYNINWSFLHVSPPYCQEAFFQFTKSE